MKAACRGCLFCTHAAAQHIAGAIEADMQHVSPKRNTQLLLEQCVNVYGTVVKLLAYKGKILNHGVVCGNVFRNLIHQRAFGRGLGRTHAKSGGDGCAVLRNLDQRRA